MQDGDNLVHFQQSTFYGIDSSYSLPNNTALLTLQVCSVVASEIFRKKFQDRTLTCLLTFHLISLLMCIYYFYETSAGIWKWKSAPKIGSPLRGCNYFTDLGIIICGSIL